MNEDMYVCRLTYEGQEQVIQGSRMQRTGLLLHGSGTLVAILGFLCCYCPSYIVFKADNHLGFEYYHIPGQQLG